MRRSFSSFVLSLALLGTLLFAGGSAHALEGCADPSAGGEWSSYGQNLHNARNQTAEATIDAGNVAGLEASWAYLGDRWENMRSTPVVADGCVYVTAYGPGVGLGTSATASVMSINAETGALVWQTRLPAPPNLIPGVYSPTVSNGRVFVAVSAPGSPYVSALDQETGQEIWTNYLYQGLTEPEPATGINASMVAFDGMLFVPLTGADAVGASHPAFYIIDAETGMMLKRTNVIPQEYWTSNFSGGGIWTTAAVDTDSKHLYVGTSNPYNKRHEHPRTNALLKIDVDPKRFTFGEVVSFHKGDVDYNPEVYHSPECRYLAELILVGFSTFCEQDDVDFGASPNLWRTSSGRLLVGDLQKSGTFHAVDADTMEVVWQARELSGRSAGGNAATAAYDDTTIYVAPNGGRIYALDKDTGAQRWVTEYGDGGGKYQPMTVANGVVYTLGNNGFLYAFDTADGSILVERRLEGAGASCSASAGAGIAIARNTIFAPCDVRAGTIDAVGIPSIVTGDGGALFALRL